MPISTKKKRTQMSPLFVFVLFDCFVIFGSLSCCFCNVNRFLFVNLPYYYTF